MYDFNIELPKEVLTEEKHDKINFDALEGKIIIGLMGYSKSGKDFIAKKFVDNYGYQRVAFADNIKVEMNKYLKKAICEDINNREIEEVNRMTAEGTFVDWRPLTPDKIDFFTEDLELKKILRPYIIWYGEKLRTINGKFYWINKAFAEDAKNMNKIVLSDVRRLAELDVFRDSNEFKKRTKKSFSESGILSLEGSSSEVNNYGTLLFQVSQFGLTDKDALTIETIQYANENWMVDDVFYVDSRIPSMNSNREKAIDIQVNKVVKKFGIEKPEKIKGIQTTIFQEEKETN
jgi:hypothetical protein